MDLDSGDILRGIAAFAGFEAAAVIGWLGFRRAKSRDAVHSGASMAQVELPLARETRGAARPHATARARAAARSGGRHHVPPGLMEESTRRLGPAVLHQATAPPAGQATEHAD